MLRRALLEENCDPIPRVANPAREFLELSFQNLVISLLHHFGNARLERDQATGDRVRDKIDIAHTKLAAFAKIGFRLHRIEKLLKVVDQLGCKPDPSRVAHNGKQPFARPRVVEPLNGRS